MRVGFIGVGVMGAPIARNILKGGFPLTVHDVDGAAADRLVAAGATRAESPRAVTTEATSWSPWSRTPPMSEAFRSRPQRCCSRSPTPGGERRPGPGRGPKPTRRLQLVRQPIPAAFWEELKAEDRCRRPRQCVASALPDSGPVDALAVHRRLTPLVPAVATAPGWKGHGE